MAQGIFRARTLPLRVAPREGEAIDSWLEAIAIRNGTPIGDVLSRCGIQPDKRYTAWLVSPTRDELERVAAVSGVGVEEIQAMTLSRYSPIVLKIDRARRRVARSAWAWHVGSRFCPDCLQESGGRWQLGWRLNWSFACVEHRCLLADACPVCGSRQRRQGHYTTGVPDPGRCARLRHCAQTRKRLPCGANLGTAEVLHVPVSHPVLLAQQAIDDLLNRLPGRFLIYSVPLGAEDALTDIKLMARSIVHSAGDSQLRRHLPADVVDTVVRHRRSTAWPHGIYWNGAWKTPLAIDTAAGVTFAVRFLNENLPAAINLLQQLMGNGYGGSPYREPTLGHETLSQTVRFAHREAYELAKANRRLVSRFKTPTSTQSAKRSSIGIQR